MCFVTALSLSSRFLSGGVHFLLLLVMLLQCAFCVRVDLGPFQDQILDQHNQYRRDEKASNMYLMKWNTSLEAEATNWARNCEFKHQMGGLGENLAFATMKMDTDKMLDGLMNGWHEEKREWRYGPKSCGFACHYTQLVWHSTNAVGCAATRCPSMSGMMGSIKNAFYLVCFYYPRGNWIGQVPYIPGRACSKCGDGATCSQDLCDSTGLTNTVAAAPASVSLRRPIHDSRNHISFIRRTSRFETFSHGSGANRKTVSRGTSSVHRSGPLSSRSLMAPQNLLSHNTLTLSDQRRPRTHGQANRPRQAMTRATRVDHLFTQKTSSRRQTHVQESRHNTIRPRSRCQDRHPACWRWSDRCASNRALKVMCPKTCGSCQMVFALIDGRQKNKSGPQAITLGKTEQKSGSDTSKSYNQRSRSQQNNEQSRSQSRNHLRQQQQTVRQVDPRRQQSQHTVHNRYNRRQHIRGQLNHRAQQHQNALRQQQIRLRQQQHYQRQQQSRHAQQQRRHRQPQNDQAQRQNDQRQMQNDQRQMQNDQGQQQSSHGQKLKNDQRKHHSTQSQHQVRHRQNQNDQTQRQNYQRLMHQSSSRQRQNDQKQRQVSRRQSHTSSRHHPSRQRPYSYHHGTRESTLDSRRHHVQQKQIPATIQRKPGSSDNPHCRDNVGYASRCVVWAKAGFCDHNYMLKSLYCRKSCASC